MAGVPSADPVPALAEQHRAAPSGRGLSGGRYLLAVILLAVLASAPMLFALSLGPGAVTGSETGPGSTAVRPFLVVPADESDAVPPDRLVRRAATDPAGAAAPTTPAKVACPQKAAHEPAEVCPLF